MRDKDSHEKRNTERRESGQEREADTLRKCERWDIGQRDRDERRENQRDRWRNTGRRRTQGKSDTEMEAEKNRQSQMKCWGGRDEETGWERHRRERTEAVEG